VLGAAAAVAWLTRERRAAGAVQAVLFDLDGTLVDSNDFHVQAWDAAFREGGHTVAVEAIRGQIGKGGDMLVPALLPHTTKHQQEALAERQGTIFKSRYRAKVKPFPGATALLQRVHDDGRQVILASSANQGDVDHYRRLLGAERIVDATTSTDDVNTSKPAGDIFAAALAKAKVDPAAALVIGDTPYDVEAAAKCGIAAVAVRSGGFAEEVLRGSGAIALYDDVAALLGGYAASPITRDA
jgi:HAD superfamily hydrolase (TIGR01509 family)